MLLENGANFRGEGGGGQLINKRRSLFPLGDRIFAKNDFPDQLLRMIVALGLPLKSVANIELERAFDCLNNSIRFPYFFTVKNR